MIYFLIIFFNKKLETDSTNAKSDINPKCIRLVGIRLYALT